MAEERQWFMVGAGFEKKSSDEASIQALMKNVSLACELITPRLDLDAWHATGAREIYLVLAHRPDVPDGPLVTKDRLRRGDGLFSAEFDWLQPMFTDPDLGPWRLAAYFMHCLVFISEQFGMALPLPGRAATEAPRG